MRRIGFRRVFPVVLTLIHIVLIWFALTHPSASPHIVSHYRHVAYQEGHSVPMEAFERPSLKPVQKIALILELPAMFAAHADGLGLLSSKRRSMAVCVRPIGAACLVLHWKMARRSLGLQRPFMSATDSAKIVYCSRHWGALFKRGWAQSAISPSHA
jgi:hypothetical protein